MQRITRETFACSKSNLQQLNNGVELLQRHFPPSIASLFAIPRPGKDGNLQWWTTLGGQPKLFSDLDKNTQEQLLERLKQRQAAISKLATMLEKNGHQQDADQLRFLLGSPDLSNLYSVNLEPVLVRWKLQPEPKPIPKPAPAPAAAPLFIQSSVITQRRSSIPWWVLLLLLLPLLIFLLWWLWQWQNSNTPIEHEQGMIQSFSCTPKSLPPDFAVVLDTSGSMNLNVSATYDDEIWFFQQEGHRLPDNAPRKQRILAAPSRFQVAQSSLDLILSDLHPAISTRLLTFNGCNIIHDHGLFSNEQHTQLRQELASLSANDGTPLALSLAKAASLVDGRDKDAVILMFVDGEDGCGQNVCSVAAHIAQEQPKLRVNVVNISENTLSDCIAEHTGGQVFASTDSLLLIQQLRSAVTQVALDPSCASAL